MIKGLLFLLGVAAVLTSLYVVTRLVIEIYRLFAERSRGKGNTNLPPIWRDVKAIAIAAQIVTLLVIIGVSLYLWNNFTTRADRIGLDLSFDFLDQPGNITVADNSLIPGDNVAEAIKQGFFNTIRIILVGMPLALILGTLIGIARLSTNWLLRKIATGYVEFVRNIPPLVVIIVVWRAVFLEGFPRSQEAWRWPGG